MAAPTSGPGASVQASVTRTGCDGLVTSNVRVNDWPLCVKTTGSSSNQRPAVAAPWSRAMPKPWSTPGATPAPLPVSGVVAADQHRLDHRRRRVRADRAAVGPARRRGEPGDRRRGVRCAAARGVRGAREEDAHRRVRRAADTRSVERGSGRLPADAAEVRARRDEVGLDAPVGRRPAAREDRHVLDVVGLAVGRAAGVGAGRALALVGADRDHVLGRAGRVQRAGAGPVVARRDDLDHLLRARLRGRRRRARSRRTPARSRRSRRTAARPTSCSRCALPSSRDPPPGRRPRRSG